MVAQKGKKRKRKKKKTNGAYHHLGDGTRGTDAALAAGSLNTGCDPQGRTVQRSNQDRQCYTKNSGAEKGLVGFVRG